MNRSKLVPLIVIAGLILSAALGRAQSQPATATAPTGSVSLAEAVAIALTENPVIEAATAGQEAAGHALRQAKAARLPRLSVSEGFTRGNNPVFAFGSLLEQGRFGPQNFAIDSLNNPDSLSNFRTSLDLQLPLLNRRGISSAVGQAEAGREMAAAEAERARQQLRFQTIQAYFGLILARQQERVARQTVEAARAEETRVANMVDQGVRVRSDLLAAQAQRAEFEQRVIEASANAASALAALNTLLGRPLTNPLLVEGIAKVSFGEPPLDTWLAEVSERRPEVQKDRARVRQQERALSAARGQWQPTLSLFAQYGASTSDWSSGSSDYALGAQLRLDLVDFSRRPAIERAASQVRLAQAELRRQEQKAALEIVQAYQLFRSARARRQVAEAAVHQAAEALRIVRDRHEVGITTITELLRARAALLGAELNRLHSEHQEIVSYAGLLLAAGRLTGVDHFTR